MSESRKDIRAKLDPDLHAALVALAEADGVDIGEFVERELVKTIVERVRLITIAARALDRAGITGKLLGQTGNGRENQGSRGSRDGFEDLPGDRVPYIGGRR